MSLSETFLDPVDPAEPQDLEPADPGADLGVEPDPGLHFEDALDDEDPAECGLDNSAEVTEVIILVDRRLLALVERCLLASLG